MTPVRPSHYSGLARTKGCASFERQDYVRKQLFYGVAVLTGVAVAGSSWFGQSALAAGGAPKAQAAPAIFQAAGPTLASIQSMVDAYREALGANNGNAPGPLAEGRREINWDGGGSTATAAVPTPFDGFLNNRGARFTTPGSGFVQAPLDGLVTTFGNASYLDIFQAFSPVRLFSAIDSNVTRGRFFVPGGGELAATTKGFGAVFSDVDQQSDEDRDTYGYGHKDKYDRKSEANTSIAYYDVWGRLLFQGDVPASPGAGSVSFFGIVLDDARIAQVRITSGNVAPGKDDTSKRDVVMMDDFIYGEPQLAK